jgi:hypothetical protein
MLHLLSLPSDPPVLQDEVQIIDFGRTSLDPGSEWGISWNIRESRPVLPASYLAVAVQELAFRVSAPSNWGPRTASILGALIAGICAFGWLRNRNASNSLALVLALAFVLDPVFSEIYRRGRVDGLAIAACLGACWLLRVAASRAASGQLAGKQLFSAGALTAASPFIWSTTPVLFPLIALEYLHVARAHWRSSELSPARRLSPLIVPTVAGGVIAGLVLAIPIMLNWEAYWSSLLSSAQVQARAAVIQNSPLDLFVAHSPFLALMTVAALLVRRELGLIIAMAFAIAMVYQTMIYLPRIIYLIPYLLAMIAVAGTHVLEKKRNNSVRQLFVVMLGVWLGWNAVSVLIARPFAALQQWPANDPARVVKQLEQRIGPGQYRVLLEGWEAYYAGRTLGWRMYRAGSPV